ncbi:hypothetical protein D6774_02450 [Candidatus Woesearchaeota archaeon]|nr:MAG: hypothetical protein D6774_02450 [Candidatus Woesearchaeota archaeon]
MNKRGKLATSIVTSLFLLAMIGVISLSGPSITGAAAGGEGPVSSALITMFFVLALATVLSGIVATPQKIREERQQTFSDVNTRLKEIDEQLKKIF